jgi:hypothetical protein
VDIDRRAAVIPPLHATNQPTSNKLREIKMHSEAKPGAGATWIVSMVLTMREFGAISDILMSMNVPSALTLNWRFLLIN